MPVLPLDHPDPLMGTLAVMHYPATEAADQRRARALTARLLAGPLEEFHSTGGRLTYEELALIATGAGEPIEDFESRHFGGTAMGELFKMFFALHNTDPILASWENAIKLARVVAREHELPASRSFLHETRRRFMPVAHLWAALSIREGRWMTDPSCGYEGTHDFALFLAESEILRRWGQTWRHPRDKSRPPLPEEVWCPPDHWAPPEHQPGWPTQRGRIPHIFVEEDQLRRAKVRRPGRPKKSG